MANNICKNIDTYMAFKGLYFPLFHQLLNKKVIFLNLLSPSFHQSQKFVLELLIMSPIKI